MIVVQMFWHVASGYVLYFKGLLGYVSFFQQTKENTIPSVFCFFHKFCEINLMFFHVIKTLKDIWYYRVIELILVNIGTSWL